MKQKDIEILNQIVDEHQHPEEHKRKMHPNSLANLQPGNNLSRKGRPRGSLNKKTYLKQLAGPEIKSFIEWCKETVNNPIFRQNLINKNPELIAHYAEGKPVQKLEVTQLSPEGKLAQMIRNTISQNITPNNNIIDSEIVKEAEKDTGNSKNVGSLELNDTSGGSESIN